MESNQQLCEVIFLTSYIGLLSLVAALTIVFMHRSFSNEGIVININSVSPINVDDNDDDNDNSDTAATPVNADDDTTEEEDDDDDAEEDEEEEEVTKDD